MSRVLFQNKKLLSLKNPITSLAAAAAAICLYTSVPRSLMHTGSDQCVRMLRATSFTHYYWLYQKQNLQPKFSG
jgi:hypothetical protein